MNTKLQLLRGTITDLSIERGEESFVQSQSDRNVGAGVATGLAAAGLAFRSLPGWSPPSAA